MKKKKYYAVVRGRKPGIYTQWFGTSGAEEQVKGFPKARFKGFASKMEAEAFLHQGGPGSVAPSVPKKKKTGTAPTPPLPGPEPTSEGRVVIYTDGGCRNNPGPGGWGAVVMRNGHRVELSGGFSRTTNNRMELMACIKGLEAVEPGTDVALHSDSRYVVNGIGKGWAKKWRARGWMRTASEKALNADLWKRLLSLCETRQVAFVWVKGHAGIAENERCDQLAGRAMRQSGLGPDPGYPAI